MFHLIITIVAIALGVAATAAAMYYGGDNLTQGRVSADAAAFVTGGQQIAGAAQMYAAEEGSQPTAVSDLTDGSYLSGLPTVSGGGTWSLDTADRLVKEDTVDADVCTEINKQAGITTPDSVTTIDGLYGCISPVSPATTGTFQMSY